MVATHGAILLNISCVVRNYLLIDLWASVVLYGLSSSCIYLKICGYNVNSMYVLKHLIMEEGYSKHTCHPFIYNGYFTIQTEFSRLD